MIEFHGRGRFETCPYIPLSAPVSGYGAGSEGEGEGVCWFARVAICVCIGRLVDALERGRPEYGRSSRPSTSLVAPALSAAQPRHVVGISANRLEAE